MWPSHQTLLFNLFELKFLFLPFCDSQLILHKGKLWSSRVSYWDFFISFLVNPLKGLIIYYKWDFFSFAAEAFGVIIVQDFQLVRGNTLEVERLSLLLLLTSTFIWWKCSTCIFNSIQFLIQNEFALLLKLNKWPSEPLTFKMASNIQRTMISQENSSHYYPILWHYDRLYWSCDLTTWLRYYPFGQMVKRARLLPWSLGFEARWPLCTSPHLTSLTVQGKSVASSVSSDR